MMDMSSNWCHFHFTDQCHFAWRGHATLRGEGNCIIPALGECRDYSAYATSQWETAFQCKAISPTLAGCIHRLIPESVLAEFYLVTGVPNISTLTAREAFKNTRLYVRCPPTPTVLVGSESALVFPDHVIPRNGHVSMLIVTPVAQLFRPPINSFVLWSLIHGLSKKNQWFVIPIKLSQK